MIELVKKNNNLQFTDKTPVDTQLSNTSPNPLQNKVITEKFNQIEENFKSPWEGKTAVFYGDSLTEKNGHYTKGYHQWVKEILGLESYVNYGKSGNKLSDIYHKVNSTNTTADIVFVMGGVNDQTYSVPLGTPGDTTTDTTYGSVNLLCDRLKSKYPTSTIIFITPHYQTKYPHNKGITSYEISKAIKEACERYAITVYDNYTLSEIFIDNLVAYTTDSCHWNNKAHELVGKNLASFVLNTFVAAATYSAPTNTNWIGKAITVEKNFNTEKNFAHLTALVEVDDDIKLGTIITASLKGKGCFNLIEQTCTGGVCYWDNSGDVYNGSYTGTATKGANPQHTLTIDGKTMELTISSREINRESNGARYIKVPFIITGNLSYGFIITEISVAFNGIEKPIIALGAFFADDKEIISVRDTGLFNIEDAPGTVKSIDRDIVSLDLLAMAGKEYRYTKDITSISVYAMITSVKNVVCESCVTFTTGATAPTYSVVGPSGYLAWSGTDVVNNKFVPKANTRYTIAFWYDGFIHNAIVRGVNK